MAAEKSWMKLFLSWTFQLLSSWMWVETLMWKDSSQFSIRASTIELLKPCGCILSRGESSISVTEVMWDGCGKENYQPKDREAGEELWRTSSGYYLLPEDVKDGELEYLPTTPKVFTLLYIIPGSQWLSRALVKAGEAAEEAWLYMNLTYSTGKQQQAICLFWKLTSFQISNHIIWYYSTILVVFFFLGMDCLWGFTTILGEDFIALWSPCWRRYNVQCHSLPVPMSTQKYLRTI